MVIHSVKQFIRQYPALFDRLFPIYTRLNLKRRQIWKNLAYRNAMLDTKTASRSLETAIREGRPVAAGKIGTSELIALQYYLAGKPLDEILRKEMFVNSGFFPFEPVPVERFQIEFAQVLEKMTHIAVWGNFGEASIIRRYAPNATLIDRTTLEPHKIASPWTKALEGKRVTVISPFFKSIAGQYDRRTEVWAGHQDVLPAFDLRVVRSPFSPGLAHPEEKDWFERLDRLTTELMAEPFDVCLIGAGGMSLPLATRCAAAGKVGIHMGGYTQIMFGIWGRRWDNDPSLLAHKSSAWTKPSEDETPTSHRINDNAAYW